MCVAEMLYVVGVMGVDSILGFLWDFVHGNLSRWAARLEALLVNEGALDLSTRRSHLPTVNCGTSFTPPPSPPPPPKPPRDSLAAEAAPQFLVLHEPGSSLRGFFLRV